MGSEKTKREKKEATQPNTRINVAKSKQTSENFKKFFAQPKQTQVKQSKSEATRMTAIQELRERRPSYKTAAVQSRAATAGVYSARRDLNVAKTNENRLRQRASLGGNENLSSQVSQATQRTNQAITKDKASESGAGLTAGERARMMIGGGILGQALGKMSEMNLTSQINMLEQGGLKADGFTSTARPIQTTTQGGNVITVGAYDEATGRYQGRPQFNPNRTDRTDRESSSSATKPAVSPPNNVTSPPTSTSPSTSVAVRKRLMQSSAGNPALRRRYLGIS